MDSSRSFECPLTDTEYVQLHASAYFGAGKDLKDQQTMVGCLDASALDGTGSDAYREAFLIRKASDYVPPAARKSSSRFGREVSASGAAGGWGPGKLAEGIGIDARQYIEGLLSLNR